MIDIVAILLGVLIGLLAAIPFSIILRAVTEMVGWR